MKQSNIGSFTIPQIQRMLLVGRTTAYAISALPELDRQVVAGEYRILKSKFWKWFNAQNRYRIFEEDVDFNDFFSCGDIAEMFGWKTSSAAAFLKKKGLLSDISSTRIYVRKDEFIDWYINQFRYTSDDPRLPPKNVSATYNICDVKEMLGITANSTIYHIYKREHLLLIRFGNQTLVEKESFDNWFLNQKKYPIRRKKEDGIDN